MPILPDCSLGHILSGLEVWYNTNFLNAYCVYYIVQITCQMKVLMVEKRCNLTWWKVKSQNGVVNVKMWIDETTLSCPLLGWKGT